MKNQYFIIINKKNRRAVRWDVDGRILHFEYPSQAINYMEKRLKDYLGRRYFIRKIKR